ncbi:class I SAM-dependent methyltransferase [Methylobacterium komagatae]
MDALTLIRETYAPLARKALLDIGCGTGSLARALTEEGADITGIDPGEDALAKARKAVPAARFEATSAETLPFPDDTFDGAVMLNSLHHVPDPVKALTEAARVLRPGCRLVIVEPLASGTFFDALKPIEDETEIRAAAQAAIAEAMAQGLVSCEREVIVERHESFADIDAFFARVTAVDPARADAIQERRSEAEAAFAGAVEQTADGRFALVQPLRIHVLVPAA